MTAREARERVKDPVVLVPLSALVAAVFSVVGSGWMEPPQPTREQIQRLESKIDVLQTLATRWEVTDDRLQRVEQELNELDDRIETLRYAEQKASQRITMLEAEREGERRKP